MLSTGTGPSTNGVHTPSLAGATAAKRELRRAADAELYLDLMKRSLLGLLIEDESALSVELTGRKGFDPSFRVPRFLFAAIRKLGLRVRSPDGLEIDFAKRAFDRDVRTQGRDFPVQAMSMIGLTRMNNVQACMEDVLRNGVPGDFIETGVWRGGATIFMRAILKAYQIKNRCVWVADSFEGLPPADGDKYPADRKTDFAALNDILGVSLDRVRANFERYGLLDDQVKFLKGWFKDTLPTAPIEKLAVLRLDGDMYESTMDALVNLYPKLSVGGYVIVDDYHIPACAKAIHDYRNGHGSNEVLTQIDWSAVYWRKDRA